MDLSASNADHMKQVNRSVVLNVIRNFGPISKVDKQLFHEFGERLKEVLNPFIQSFQPDAILIGGQIAKSADVFGLCQIARVPVCITTDMSVAH